MIEQLQAKIGQVAVEPCRVHGLGGLVALRQDGCRARGPLPRSYLTIDTIN